MKRLKMIVFGYGARGGIYANYALTFPEEYEVVAVVESDKVRREEAAEKIGCPVFADYRDMFAANIGADFVAVATQDNQHEEHAVACMKQGYDLLLEKQYQQLAWQSYAEQSFNRREIRTLCRAQGTSLYIIKDAESSAFLCFCAEDWGFWREK